MRKDETRICTGGLPEKLRAALFEQKERLREESRKEAEAALAIELQDKESAYQELKRKLEQSQKHELALRQTRARTGVETRGA